MATLLTLVQDTMGELGLDIPTAVVSCTANDVVQILKLMNAAGKELVRKFDWQALFIEYRFTTAYSTLTGTTTSGSAIVTGISSTAGLSSLYMATGTGMKQDTYVSTVDSGTQVTLTQTASASGTVSLTFAKVKYALPADYVCLIPRTEWDKSQHWEILGAVDPQQWQWLKSGYIATGPRIRFRVMDNYFTIWPPISSADYLGFEYKSSYWAASSTGTTKAAFTADTDVCVFDERLMVMFTKLKYFAIKGFETAELKQDFLAQLELCKSADTSSPTLSLNPTMNSILIGYENIPDSGFG